MGHGGTATTAWREGEHPEKSEFSGKFPIVGAPDGQRTIRYVSMDWSQPRVPPTPQMSAQAGNVKWL
jgi:hypothetical protein